MSKVTFKVGDKVRSYDFEPLPGRGDCYMEGVVTRVNNRTGRVWFTLDKEVFDGEDITGGFAAHVVGIEVETGLPNTLYFNEWDGRITVID